MEEICGRFPLLGDKILKKLDNQSLANSKTISRKIFGFLENSGILWKEMIKKNIIGKLNWFKVFSSVFIFWMKPRAYLVANILFLGRSFTLLWVIQVCCPLVMKFQAILGVSYDSLRVSYLGFLNGVLNVPLGSLGDL